MYPQQGGGGGGFSQLPGGGPGYPPAGQIGYGDNSVRYALEYTPSPTATRTLTQLLLANSPIQLAQLTEAL